VAWNDDSTQGGLSASGGGASALVARPSWQTGVPGIASGSKRLVPDISLYSSPALPGYLYCTSDVTNWAPASGTQAAQAASCNSGFRDSTTNYLTVAGGTSFAAPIFAGMLAIINQKAGYATGQGLINTTLYKLAADSATYAAAFHDVTTGNNNCTAGTTYCSATTGFSAGTGYDEVTGLGSIDLSTLASKWPVNAGTTAGLIATTTTVTPANTTPLVNVADTFTIAVAEAGGSGTPTGTVTLKIDGGTDCGGLGITTCGGTTLSNQALAANGTFTYSATFTTTGTHSVLAQYSGDATHAPSTGVGSVTIATTSSGKGTITLSPSPSTLTVSQGSQGTETITVTPAGGYTGTVILSYSTPTALNNLCVFIGTGITTNGAISVPSASAVSATLMLDTKASDCSSSAGAAKPGLHSLRSLRGNSISRAPKPSQPPSRLPAEVAFAGLLLAGFLGRYARKFRSAAWIILLAAAGLATTACGGGSSSSSTTVTNPPKGTYTINLSAQDSVTASITNTATFTLTIN
jgi:hypothetical protein